MSWRRALRTTGPLTGEQFAWILTKALADPRTTLDDAIDLARRIEDDRPGLHDVKWMSSFHSSFYSRRDHFVELRLRELAGIITVPHDDDYILAMIAAMGAIPSARTFLFRHDTELREEIFWRIFEVEGGGEVSLANIDKFTRFEASGTWHGVVRGLTEDEVLPRDRVLAASLDALQRDFSAYTSGWYSRLFASLDPTVDELSRLESSLLAMLSSRVAPTVSLAVRSLQSLHKAGRLDVDALAEHAAPAMLSGKANAAALVKMLVSGSGDDDASTRARTIAEALHHPHADIRSTAQDALRAMGRLDLFPAVEPPATPDARAQDEGHTGSSALTPWPPDDIVERLGSVLAGNADGIQFELALSALATLEDPAVLGPLLKVARRRMEPPVWPRVGLTTAVLIARLILEVSGERFAREHGEYTETTVIGLRSLEIGEERASGVSAGVLLSTPEDTAGWITPATFVHRLIERDRAGRAMLQADFVAALLRLSPAGRADAPARLPRVPKTASNAVAFDAARYALGGEMRPIEPLTWWIASARARNPLGDDQLLLAAGHDEPGAGRRTSVTERWKATRSNFFNSGAEYLALHIDGGPATAIDPLRPTCAPSTRRRSYSYEWDHGWQVCGDLVFPADADVAALLGLPLLVAGLESTTEFGQTEILDGLSRHPGAWGPLSASALVLGLAQRPPLTRIHSAELFAAVVPTRAPVSLIADAFVRHAPGCVATRWASTLTDASSISPEARTAVADTLAAVLPHLATGSRGMDKLLDVLMLATEGDTGILADATLREWLGSFRGSSRAARVARSLLTRME